jgi:hypothetical protein
MGRINMGGEVVEASAPDIGFILTDHPVTLQSQSLPGQSICQVSNRATDRASRLTHYFPAGFAALPDPVESRIRGESKSY